MVFEARIFDALGSISPWKNIANELKSYRKRSLYTTDVSLDKRIRNVRDEGVCAVSGMIYEDTNVCNDMGTTT